MSDAPEARGAHAPGGVAEARRALLEWVDAAGPAGRHFLQVEVRSTAPGRYRVRHRADAELSVERLDLRRDPYAAREIAQTREDGEHRPLKTAPDLRRGWSFEELDARGLWTVLEYLYPACVVHWHAGREGTLRVTSWSETASRQSGIYSAVGLLPREALPDTVYACCADAVCLRRVEWGAGPGEVPLDPDGARASTGERVPCPEACSMFVSFARKVLTVERSPRQEVPELGPMNAAELEQVREIVIGAAAGTLGAARVGEFDEPTNERRVRYLAARLGRAAGPAPP